MLPTDTRPRLGFHGFYDWIDVATTPDGDGGATGGEETPGGEEPTPGIKHVLVQIRDLRYRFSPHFHPYIGELVRRLIERSVPGLQAADTEYRTLVRLSADASATLPGGAATTLASGDLLHLPNGTRVTLSGGDAAGTKVTFSDWQVLAVDDGAPITLAPDMAVTLFNKTQATRPDGTTVTLTQDAPATLPDAGARPVLYQDVFSRYGPSDLVQSPYPVNDLDFTSGGAYAVYNWELFYHAPLNIAMHLSQNQRFEEAQWWFHYIFDPTDDSEGPTPERFWKVKPFQQTDVRMIEEILVNLATGENAALKAETVDSIAAWKDNPFRPHAVARYRQSAYMLKAVMAYLDNLIAWGDTLFRQDTIESINEATQLYVLAANILGPRPQAVPKKGSVRPRTYANLKADLQELGSVLVDLEAEIGFDVTPHPTATTDPDRASTLRGLGKALYFSVPRNDKLVGYWDTVADRLFKIHNSLNILGVFRQLPLFEPPIDPALLAKGAAAGLDVGAIVSGANQPLPLVRFQMLVQKAAEICQEVKSLGNNLLAAIEKEDNEALSILRARHERVILGLTESVRYAQWQEAIKAREGLQASMLSAVERFVYYGRLLGEQEADIIEQIPELDALDAVTLEKMKLRAKEPAVGLRRVGVDIAQDVNGVAGGRKLSTHEVAELELLAAARDSQATSSGLDMLSAYLGLIPQFDAVGEPLGVGAGTGFGGVQLSTLSRMMASAIRTEADELSYQAGHAAKIGSYARREQEWEFQSNVIAGEITQLYKQLRAAQIREYIAEREWRNHQQQIKHAEEIERFLTEEKNGKTTNQAFYAWMKREAKGLYGQCFQFAFDVAKKAERALQHELGNPDVSFLQFGYLAGKEGLLAGEKLYLDIKRMEMAYHDLNVREYELTKHASLLQVDPRALMELRATGRCKVSLPEELFDLDCPGHYFRRIRSVALSIPSVVGPYTSVNCTMTLLKSSIRKSAVTGDVYARDGAEDDRFSDYYGSLQSVVTSAAQNDSGLFGVNPGDERYQPFELSGAISDWQLELPADVRQFDYDTITDVILHIRYTAREGGALLRRDAVANLEDRIGKAQAVGSVRLLSVRHEFPTAWAKFKSARISPAAPAAELTLTLLKEHYPFWSQAKGRLAATKRADLFAKFVDPQDARDVKVSERADGSGTSVTLTKSPPLPDEFRAKALTGALRPEPIGKFTLFLDNNSVEDVWLAIAWGGAS
jgi:hypothetical protein